VLPRVPVLKPRSLTGRDAINSVSRTGFSPFQCFSIVVGIQNTRSPDQVQVVHFHVPFRHPDTTGLTSFIGLDLPLNPGAKHDVRLWHIPIHDPCPPERTCLAIRPVRVLNGHMEMNDLNLIRRFVYLNSDTIEKHWNGETGSADAIDRIRPVTTGGLRTGTRATRLAFRSGTTA